jgi:VanZ family protein
MRVFVRLPAPEATGLTARHYFWIALACLAGVLYGSFVPFHFQWRPVNNAVTEYLRIVSEPLTWESGSDCLANILLFIPLTFLWMGALCVERSRKEALLTALLVLPAASILSASIEFTQLYFPPRVTALDDILAESFGGTIGIVTWLTLGPTLTGWARRIWAALDKEGWAGNVLPAYAFFLVVIHVMPINLTISPAMIARKYHEGRILLVPFASLKVGDFETTQKLLWDLIYYAPLGWLLALLESPGWRRWSRLPMVVVIAIIAAAGMEGLQVFVWSRESDVTDALVGMLAAVGGWVVTVAFCRLSARDKRASSVVAGVPTSPGLPAMVLAAWVAIVFIAGWQPFDFCANADFLAERQAQLTWIPFADYSIQSDFNAFEQALHKTMLFLPLGAILAGTRSTSVRRRVYTVALLLAFMIASAVEVGQFYLPSHTASVTDVLIEMAGTLVGCALGVRLRAALTQEALPEWRTHGIHS